MSGSSCEDVVVTVGRTRNEVIHAHLIKMADMEVASDGKWHKMLDEFRAILQKAGN